MSKTSQSVASRRGENQELILTFDDNQLLTELFGEHDRNLALIEDRMDVTVTPRGNRVVMQGTPEAQSLSATVLKDLYKRLERGLGVGRPEIEAAIRMATDYETNDGNAAETAETEAKKTEIATAKRRISPRSPRQAEYIDAIRNRELVFGLGPAGTGKTYLAVAAAVSMLFSGRVDRLILSRPAVEAGERLGFLPGDIAEKIDPYLRPLYDALYDTMPGDQVLKRLHEGQIEVAPLAFMRGRTLSNAFVILDEAQNTTPMQMKMFLTRMGENSKMVINGDPSQVDLPGGERSGLIDAVETLKEIEEIGFINFTDSDVVRHHLVTRMVQAYSRHDHRRHLAQKPERSNAGERADSDDAE